MAVLGGQAPWGCVRSVCGLISQWCVLARQVVVGRFVADYLAPAVRLIVEVDGPYHSRRVAADARRDRVLQRLGYRVLRLEAELVRCNLQEAVERVRLAVGVMG